MQKEMRELLRKVKGTFCFQAIDEQQHISMCGLTQAHRSRHNAHLSGPAPACGQMDSLC